MKTLLNILAGLWVILIVTTSLTLIETLVDFTYIKLAIMISLTIFTLGLSRFWTYLAVKYDNIK
jgi:hypothetical protein